MPATQKCDGDVTYPPGFTFQTGRHGTNVALRRLGSGQILRGCSATKTARTSGAGLPRGRLL
jgi:hypothetical protein